MQRFHTRILVALLLGLLLVVAHRTMLAATSHGGPRELWGTVIGSFELGMDIWPACLGEAGFVELWYRTPNADDVTIVARLYGTPALPSPATPPRPALPRHHTPDQDMVQYRES